MKTVLLITLGYIACGVIIILIAVNLIKRKELKITEKS